jgi:ribosomal protein S18 acetylase RimI-like enzyme
MRRKPKEWFVKVDYFPPNLDAYITDGIYDAGYARLKVEGAQAWLGDIKIYDGAMYSYGFILDLVGIKRHVNYQGKGLGTRLLSEVLVYLSKLGVNRVEGEMKGDYERLSRWYRSLGFTVDEVTRRIALQL